MSAKEVFTDGIVKNNPTFIQLIGLCSVLAVSVTSKGAFGIGFNGFQRCYFSAEKVYPFRYSYSGIYCRCRVLCYYSSDGFGSFCPFPLQGPGYLPAADRC